MSGRDLRDAAWNGDVEKVKQCLKDGADINSRDIVGWTALMCASGGGHTEVVKILVENKADLNVQDEYGRTALMEASIGGHTEVVKILVENKTDLNVQDDDGWTALMWASYRGHTEVVKILVENKADLNVQDKYGDRALMVASRGGHTEVVKILVENKADLNVQDEDGRTALMLASEEGHTEVVKILVENKADLNVQDKIRSTALMLASKKGHTEVVKILNENTADLNVQNKDGRTALMSASKGHYNAGKTRLRKQLLEQDYIEGSTVGIETDPHACYVEVDEAINWKPIKECKPLSFKHILSNKMFKTRNKSADSPVRPKPIKENVYKTPKDPVEISEADKEIAHDFGIHTLPIAGVPKENEVGEKTCAEISVWDFGGQSLYYTTHQPFLSSQSIYLLVTDASLNLDDVPCRKFRWANESSEDMRNTTLPTQSTKTMQEKDISSGYPSTVSEHLKFWLDSIHMYAYPTQAGASTGDWGPPVLLVCTHKDCHQRYGLKDVIMELKLKKSQLQHLYRLEFNIDCTNSADEGISQLKENIIKLAAEVNDWGKEIPIPWFNLRDKLKKLEEKCVDISKVESIAAKETTAFNKEDIGAFLTFHHEFGDFVVHYPGEESVLKEVSVITEPQWMINAFRYVIRIRNENEQGKLGRYWDTLSREGILAEELIDEEWKHDQSLVSNKEVLLELMQKFHIICPKSERRGTVVQKRRYFVPCLLRRVSDAEKFSLPPGKGNALIYQGVEKFLPDAVFHRLIVCCLREWRLYYDRGTEQETTYLFGDYAVFVIAKGHRDLLILSKSEYCIKLEIKASNDHTVNFSDTRAFVERSLNTLRKMYCPNLKYYVCIEHGSKPLPVTEEEIREKLIQRPQGDVDIRRWCLIWFREVDSQTTTDTCKGNSQDEISGTQSSSGKKSKTNVDDTSQEVKHEHMKYLSKQEAAKEKWKGLARELSVQDKIPDLEKETNLEEVIYKVLEIWKQRNGSKATVRNLGKALEEEELLHIAGQLTGM